MNRDQDIRHECELSATEAALTITEIETAVDAVLARLPNERLVRLGLCCQHPEFLEEAIGPEAGDWADVLEPLVGRRLLELAPNRVVEDIRTRALIGALKDGLRYRPAP